LLRPDGARPGEVIVCSASENRTGIRAFPTGLAVCDVVFGGVAPYVDGCARGKIALKPPTLNP
jgi:hypothetical protein